MESPGARDEVVKLLNKISKLFQSAGSASVADGSPGAVIIDVESLYSPGGHGRQPSTQEKISALNRLAQFVEREKVPLTAFFYGTPMRAVAEGESFRGVTVHYVTRRDDAARFMPQLVRKGRNTANTVVVTADRQVEAAAIDAGSQVMNAATFRKALEPVEQPRPRQHSRPPSGPAPATVPKPEVDENKRIVDELIDPL